MQDHGYLIALLAVVLLLGAGKRVDARPYEP